jgi:hypothetical protein
MPKRRSSRDIDRVGARHDQEPSAPRAGRRVAGLGSGATIAIAVTALHNPWFAAVVAVLATSVLYGVVMPAIWSRCPARQRAARAVIRDLLRWTQRRL